MKIYTSGDPGELNPIEELTDASSDSGRNCAGERDRLLGRVDGEDVSLSGEYDVEWSRDYAGAGKTEEFHVFCDDKGRSSSSASIGNRWMDDGVRPEQKPPALPSVPYLEKLVMTFWSVVAMIRDWQI